MTDIVERAGDLLPKQGILENFVHHNPLENFEHMKFQEALDHVHEMECFLSPSQRTLILTRVNPMIRVSDALVELSSVFLDRGAAKWVPEYRDRGFLYFFATLEGLGGARWRKYARKTALKYLESEDSSENIIKENLEFFGVPEEEYVDVLRSMMLELRGWAGMFQRMESHPNEAPMNTKVRLIDFCAVQTILVRSSIVPIAHQAGWKSSKMTFGQWLSASPKTRHEEHEEAVHPSSLSYVDQCPERRDVMENDFSQKFLNSIRTNQIPKKEVRSRPKIQLFTCIDDREGSFRRHFEAANPGEIETFGVAGFFGIPIRFQGADDPDQMILAPEGNNPTALLIEQEKTDHVAITHKQRTRLYGHMAKMWENAAFSLFGSLALSTVFFPVSITRLILMGVAPRLKQTLKEKFTLFPKARTDFQVPFTPEQSAELLAKTFKDIGSHHRFAPIIIVMGHGASSTNNPFNAAYQCGACGGREGGPNARLLARIANDKEVRMILLRDYDVEIPDDTVFIGATHNTTSDNVAFFDVDSLPETHTEQFSDAMAIIEEARGKNALERCFRFSVAKDIHTTEEALKHVKQRSTDTAEIRPELNHASNAAVVVGRRELTKGRFMDRRAFFSSYDPYSDDDMGTNLEHVLSPALIVCSGINLEYFFSTIDEHHSAGTKAPLNIVGNVGVLQGVTGDLRCGLPSQMTEMHVPIRALYVIDAPVDRVKAVIDRREDLKRLVHNEWVRLFVRDPETGIFYSQSGGEYIPTEIEPTGTISTHNEHRKYALIVSEKEDIHYWSAVAAMVLSCGVPIALYGAETMNPYGSIIAVCATVLSVAVVSFARRYLHGEYMFGRVTELSAALLLGFNLVSTAPTLWHAMMGWSLFGFASTFLIGAYNDRITVRNNVAFAFAAYRISDFAMLVAVTFSAVNHSNPVLVAAGLLLAALFKSSQFPLTSLFVRSMEGPTPASALGYAGLSAHLGIVLLTSTMPYWFEFEWARYTLGFFGIVTAVYSTLIAKTRADRKGAIANATAATLGLIFVTLALGYPTLSLVMALGHASFRMTQILRSPNMIADRQKLRSALGTIPWPEVVPTLLYKISWALRRFDSDFHMVHLLHWISRPIVLSKPLKLTKFQQYSITAGIIILAGAPFTPFSHYLEEMLMELLPHHPLIAGLIMASHFVVSVVAMRFLFLNVLNARRFGRKRPTTVQNINQPLNTK